MKRARIVRHQQTDVEQTQSAADETFYVRHDRFFTLLGSVIIFMTF
jgi:hypothetical protein